LSLVLTADRARICLATDSLEPSGMGHQMLHVLGALVERHDVVVAVPAVAAADQLADGARALGAPVWSLPDAARALQAESLASWLRKWPVDLVHVNAGIAWEGHELAQAARQEGVAAVIRTEHCPYVLTKPIDAELYRRGIQAVDCIVCVSEGVRRSFVGAGISPSLLVTVPNGVEPRAPRTTRTEIRAALGIAADAPLAVSVGRLTEQKGHLGLAAAVPAVLAAVPSARFVWVGDGPLRDEIARRLADLGLTDAVTSIGSHPDIPALLGAADTLVQPSRFEGLPLVVLEAMAAGIPVVGTDVIGVADAVLDGITGRLAPYGDTLALAEAIITVLSDRETRERWGAAGRARQQSLFTAAGMAAATASVHEELLLERAAGQLQAVV
jgi:glycosyltransferase involved in cell wall biosynthesis